MDTITHSHYIEGSPEEAAAITGLLPCVLASARGKVPGLHPQRQEEMLSYLRLKLVSVVRRWNPSKGLLRTYAIMRLRFWAVEYLQEEKRERPERYGVTVESYDGWARESEGGGGAGEVLDWTERLADPAPTPPERLLSERDNTHLIESVLLACLKLSPSDRHMLYLLYWRGLSWAEAGAALGIAKETVAYRQRRVFAELRARLSL